MPLLNALTVVSFHRLNPDWDINIYYLKQNYRDVNKNIDFRFNSHFSGEDSFGIIEDLARDNVNVSLFEYDASPLRNKGIHSILISDIWRREILYENGGLYSDFDVIWLNPMSEFINIECLGNAGDFEALVSMHELTHSFHNVSNIMSEKHSPFTKSLIEATWRVAPPFSDQAFGTELLNRTYPDWNSIVSKFPRMLAIKYETFYPYSTFNMGQLFVDNDLRPLKSKNVMGIHWFNGNYISKDYINNNGYERDCSMTTILKQEGYL